MEVVALEVGRSGWTLSLFLKMDLARLTDRVDVEYKRKIEVRDDLNILA